MIKRLRRTPQLCTIILIALIAACNSSDPTEIPERSSSQLVITLPPTNTPTATSTLRSAPMFVTPTPGVETEVPTIAPTIGPTEAIATETFTPTPAKQCEDRAAFVRDVSYPDGTLIRAGESFQKTWRVSNAGTCTWTEEYSLAFHSGDSMGTYVSVPLANSVPPGHEINLSIELTAPLFHGRHKSYWMLRNEEGLQFGFGQGSSRPFWVDVVVRSVMNPRCNVDQIPIEPPTSTIGVGVYTVVVSGTYAFATTSKGFSVFDVADPANPTRVNTLNRARGWAAALVVRDERVYFGGDTFSVYDISNPVDPYLAGELFVGIQSIDMAVAGNFAYVLNFESGLHVIDIRDPTQPTEIGHSDPIKSAKGLAVQGNYAFVGGYETKEDRGYGFLKVFDLTNPASPEEVSSVDIPGISVEDVVVSGGKAYLSVLVDAYNYDFWILDVSNPRAPVPLGSFERTNIIWDMVVRGACAFMINFEAEGFIALDVSNPFAIREIGVLNMTGFPNKLAVEGGVVYIADRDEGLLLLPMISSN